MIDYGLINNAIDYYDSQGFLRIETPWLVSKDIADLTKPLDASTYIVQKDVETKQKAFVASGEQSFLYLINKGHMPSSGRYQTVTPCLRDDAWDTTHMKNFVKLELIEYNIDVNIDDAARVKRMVDQALGFFSKHVDRSLLTVVKCVTDGAVSYDINLNDIEIGSYGYRNCSFCNWIYGTGIAEPRFSRLLKQTHGVY
jgi:hypothetical protein